MPFKIKRGYKDTDEFVLEIPSIYKLSMLPEDKEIVAKFGTYKLSFEKINDLKIKYKKTFLLKAGNYNKDDYNLYRNFRRSITKLENLRIGINKK